MDNGKDIVDESWDVKADLETVRKKWAEFTTALRYAPVVSASSDARLSWVRPETEGEAEQISFEEISPEVTRVNVAVGYDDDDLAEEGETFADVARRMDEDMALFKDFAEGRVSCDGLTTEAS